MAASTPTSIIQGIKDRIWHQDSVATRFPPQQVHELWYVPHPTFKPVSGWNNASTGLAKRVAQKMGMTLRIIDRDLLTTHHLQRSTAPTSQLMPLLGIPKIILGDLQPDDEATVRSTRPCPFYQSSRPDIDFISPAMTHITSEELAHWREPMRQAWEKHPVIQVIVNHTGKSIGMARQHARAIVEKLKDLPHATVFVTDTPRSSKIYYHALTRQLLSELHQLPESKERFSTHCHYFDHRDVRKQNNPYIRCLAAADAIITIGESQSVAGDATLTGCPIYLLGDNPPLDRAIRGATLVQDPCPERFRSLEASESLSFERLPSYDLTEYHAARVIERFADHQRRFHTMSAQSR